MLPTDMDPETLRAQAGAVRALAHALVRDPHTADDIAQDTWLAALGSKHPSPTHPLGWLRGIVRNLARSSHRERGRRPTVDSPTPGPFASSPSPDDALEQVTLQRDLAAALIDLGDPYRTVLVLRYWHDLPPRAIAERLGVPVATVKTHLQRGLAKLRVRLDATHGRERWLAVAAAFAYPRGDGLPTGPMLLAAVMANKSKAVLVAGVFAALATAAYLMPLGSAGNGPGRRSGTATLIAAAPEHPGPGDAEPTLAADRIERLRVPTVSETTDRASAMVTGRVLAPDGSPVGDAVVSLTNFGLAAHDVQPTAHTGRQGRFELQTLAIDGFPVTNLEPPNQHSELLRYLSVRTSSFAERVLEIDSDTIAALASGTSDLGDIQLERGPIVRGRIERNGRPVAVRAALLLSPNDAQDTPILVPRSSWWIGETRPDGTFVLPSRLAPARHGYTLIALWPDGAAWGRTRFVTGTEDDVELMLEAPPTTSLDVLIVDQQGRPIEAARVTVCPGSSPVNSLGSWPTAIYRPVADLLRRHTDARGNTSFDALPLPATFGRSLYQVQVHKPGYAEHVETVPFAPGIAGATTITLSKQNTWTIRGAVRDSFGQPIEGARVTALARGSWSSSTKATGDYVIEGVEDTDSNAIVRCDAPGFESVFDNLLLEASDAGNSIRHDLVLRELAPISGTVTDDLGHPVAGARIWTESRHGRGLWYPGEMLHPPTDEHGRFVASQTPVGEQRIRAEPPPPEWLWRVTEEVTVQDGADGVNLSLERWRGHTVAIDLEIVDAETGEELGPLDVTLTPEDQSFPPAPIEVRLGSITATAVLPLRTTLCFTVPDYGRVSRVLDPTDAAATFSQRIEVGRPGILEGRVDLDRIAADSVIVVVQPHDEISRSVLPDGTPEPRVNGNTSIIRRGDRTTFRFEGVSSDRDVEVHACAGPEHYVVPVRLEPGETREVVLPPP